MADVDPSTTEEATEQVHADTEAESMVHLSSFHWAEQKPTPQTTTDAKPNDEKEVEGGKEQEEEEEEEENEPHKKGGNERIAAEAQDCLRRR